MGSSKVLRLSLWQFASRGVQSSGEPVMAQPGGSCMLSKRVVLAVVALGYLFALTPSALFSQAASTGTVAGTVTDPTGAAVAGAAVTLIDPSTNDARKTTSNDGGRFLFANVPPGTYNVTINKTGFRVTKMTGQVVNVGSTITLNVARELGSVSQIVEVTANGAELQV